MAVITGANSSVRLMDDGRTVLISSPSVENDEGIDISQYCRAANIALALDSVNLATIEIVGPAVEVLAELKEVRVIHVCSECQKEVE